MIKGLWGTGRVSGGTREGGTDPLGVIEVVDDDATTLNVGDGEVGFVVLDEKGLTTDEFPVLAGEITEFTGGGGLCGITRVGAVLGVDKGGINVEAGTRAITIVDTDFMEMIGVLTTGAKASGHVDGDVKTLCDGDKVDLGEHAIVIEEETGGFPGVHGSSITAVDGLGRDEGGGQGKEGGSKGKEHL